jgi:hypothetical protein
MNQEQTNYQETVCINESRMIWDNANNRTNHEPRAN